jgi:transcriptional regulator with XRE-family HTH domain
MKRVALQQYRLSIALSQKDVARACLVNESTVRRWESGETDPQPVHRRRLAAVLHLDQVRLAVLLEGNPIPLPLTEPPEREGRYDAGMASDPARAALEWILDADGPLLTLAATGPGRTRRVGTDLLEQVASRIIRWRLADDITPTRILLPEVAGEIDRVEAVLAHHSYTDATGRRLHGMLAELHQLAGWMAIDQGKTARGERYYAAGARAAQVAGDDVLTAQLFSCHAYQKASRGEDALLLARAAVRGAGAGLTPLARILFVERVAWAAAQNGDADTCRKALDEVDDTYTLVGTEPEAHWTYWLNRDESDVMAARCHLRLGDPGRATALLRPAIDRYPAEHKREKALYLSWLAEAHAVRGKLDAVGAVVDEIESLDVDSARLRTRLKALA